MSQRAKYVRVLIDAEVQVLDDDAIRDPHADLDLPDFPGSAQGYDVGRVLMQALHEGVTPDTGIKVMGASVLPRRKSEDGSTYDGFTFPTMPTRGDDGKLSDES